MVTSSCFKLPLAPPKEGRGLRVVLAVVVVAVVAVEEAVVLTGVVVDGGPVGAVVGGRAL